MAFQQRLQRIIDDIVRQSETYALYRRVASDFDGVVEIPENLYSYIHRAYDGAICLELSPESSRDDANLRPLIHKFAQGCHIRFTKRKNYDNSALVYEAEFMFKGVTYRLKITDVVPATCKVVEKHIPLSDEELAAAQREALNNVKSYRVEREIICDEPDDEEPDFSDFSQEHDDE